MVCSLSLVQIIQKMRQTTETEGTDWVRGIVCTGKPQEVTFEVNERTSKECENSRLNTGMHMSSSSARAGFREATGIRRPPFWVRQRAGLTCRLLLIRILRLARPHAADPVGTRPQNRSKTAQERS